MSSNRLITKLGTLELTSPLLTGSGTFGHDGAALIFSSPSDIGAYVLKTVTPQPRHGNPAPRLHETPSGLLNSIGLENRGVEHFIAHTAPQLAQLEIPVVANAGGKNVDQFVEMVEAFCDLPAINAIEINLSCPNVDGASLSFSRSPEVVSEVISRCHEVSNKPLWAKLSPNVTLIAPMAIAAEAAGAEALTVCNTVLGLAVDWRNRKPALGVGYGGLSGPAIHPIAMRMVWEASQVVEIPVVACGGVSCADHVLQFLVAGASAVQIGTSSMRDPGVFSRIAADLRVELAEADTSVAELVGSLEWPS
ncbi:MAG: dihydroorotate dehydrogenase B catalytic subunit [Planctomycetota bacterium]|nr:MAG: dihydroorotate dehydrogenase B catalytic subunit [Planctomycetota bacterium]